MPGGYRTRDSEGDSTITNDAKHHTTTTSRVSKPRHSSVRSEINLLCGRAIVESHDELIRGALRVYNVCHQAQHVKVVRSQHASADGQVPSQLRE
jgi:hypothetical protein